MSQYLVLIYDNEAAWAAADDSISAQIHGAHTVFAEKNGPAIAGGNALQSTTTATSVRPDGEGGFQITDGPFVETKEALGGYYLVEAADLDEAIELAKQIPVVAGGLEVRPILTFE